MVGIAAAAAIPALADAPPRPVLPSNVLYVGSNINVPGQNSVFGFSRASDGSLTPLAGSPFRTGGTGYYDASFALGPFDTDFNFGVDARHAVLFAPNGGSNTVAAFNMRSDGTLSPVSASPFRTSGINPVAVTVNGPNLIVVNGDENPAQPAPGAHPSYSVARIVNNGQLVALSGTSIVLPDGAAPALALTTSRTSPFIFTNEFLGGTIRSFVQSSLGALFPLDVVTPPLEPGETAQPLPLGLAVNPRADIIYVGLVNVSRVGVYRWDSLGALHFVRSVTNSGAAVCWLRTTRDGKRLYTVNTGDNSISLYDTTDPQLPVEVQHLPLSGVAGNLFSFSLSNDERFLYALEEENGAASVGLSNQVHVVAVDPTTGQLQENTAALTKLPVPLNTRVQGILAF